jgi:ribosome-interacting GTPase 1
LVLANKCDDANTEENFEIFRELLEGDWLLLPISVTTGGNLDLLKKQVVKLLKIIRVYSKAPGKEPDLTAPFVLKTGSTVADLAGKIHKDFTVKLKTARLWGDTVYDGQMVQRDHVLQDGDVVELNI